MLNGQTPHQSLWMHYAQTALFAHQLGSLGRASRILREALHDCEEYGELPESIIRQAHTLADTYVETGRFSEAESVYRLVLELREKLLGQNHRDVMDSLKKVAAVQILAFRAETLGRKSAGKSTCWNDEVSAAS